MPGTTLYGLIQFECLKMSSHAVKVQSDNRTGWIYFAGGQVVHAETSSQSGEAAFFEMLNWRNGQFGIDEHRKPREETISRQWQGLLLEAAQIADETDPLAKTAGVSKSNGAVPVSAGSNVINLPAPMKKEHVIEIIQAPETLAGVQFTETGELLQSKGANPEELQASFAYVLELARQLGESLGLENLRAIELSGKERKGLCVVNQAGSIGLLTSAKANLSQIASKLK